MRAACAGALLVAAALALAVAADPLPQRELTAYASEADSDDESDEAPRSDGDELPAELLVSEYLFAGETKTFLFHKPKSDGPLSITVTPCTSSILWSVALRPDSDDSGPLPSPSPAPGVAPGAAPSWVAPPPGETALGEFRGRELRTLRLAPGDARAGAYAVRVRALERDSFVQLFASERAAGGGGGGGGGAASAVPAPGRTRLRLRRRRRPGHRLTVRWEPSQVDPHLTRYCLVVNPRRRYSTLCEARGELLSAGPPPPSTSDESAVRRKQRKDDKAPKKDKGKAKDKGKGHAPASVSVEKHEVGGLQAHNDIIIGCVGKRTQYTVSGLVPGRLYHFDLFAVNRRTNLSLPYGNAEMRFDARARPTALRDARAASVNLKSLDGRAAFRFKVPRPANGSAPGDLLLYVIPCGGGAVDVRAQLQQPREGSGGGGGGGGGDGGGAPGAVREVARARVEGFAALRVPAPPPGARLVLRAATPNAEELRRVSALEVFATTRAERFPFPTLPTPARLHEYDSLRRCDSVTVGWLPSAAPPGWLAPAPANASADASAASPRLRYCVTAREARPRDLETGRRADQCGLDARLRRTAAAAAAAASQDAPVRVCSDHEAAVAPPPLATLPPKKGAGGRTEAPAAEPGAVTTMALRRLRPGRAYTVQLTVQRLPAGRSLSYDLLPVHTKPSCA